MTSVIIAAYNEAAVIGRHLDLLLAGTAPGEFDVVVVANGCADETAAIARTRDVRVIDLATPGKAGALNAGDSVARSTPRIYLDADIACTADTVRALAAALTGAADDDVPAPLVAVPGRRLALDGRPLAVRCYYSVQSRLPAARSGLYGRGMIALSAAGRARFEEFPDLVADDLFLDSLFSDAERVVVTSVATVVETPRRTGDLVRRLTRVRRANADLRARAAAEGRSGVRPARPTSWLWDVVVPRPWLAPAGAVYATITLLADLRARRAGDRWEVDRSSRVPDDRGGDD